MTPFPFSAQGWRGLPWLVGTVLFFVIVILFLVRSQRQRSYAARAAALLDRIEYIEDLKLTTYYFEEVITIGTRDRVAKRVDQARLAQETAKAHLYRSELELARARVAHDQALAAFYAIDTLLAGPRQALEAARAHYAEIDKVFFGVIKQALAVQADTFGSSIATAYAFWQAQEAAVAEARPGAGRRAARQRREAAEEALRQAVSAEQEARRRNRDLWLERYHRELDLQKEVRRQRRAARDAALAYFEQQQRQYLAAEMTLLERSEALAQAETELAKAEAAGEALEPKLVVVVPVAVSGYVDLRALAYRPLDLGLATPSDTLLVVLPEPQLDSVQVDFSATENYDLARRLGFSVSEDGFYFEVFQQMQDALVELKVRVREKALAAGLREETQQLAREYVTAFAGSLGYQVRFVPTLPLVPVGPAPLPLE